MRARKQRAPRLITHEIVVPGLEPAHDGVKVAHLTDLHVGMLTPDRRIRRAVELANAARPDLVFLTGDYLCYSPKFAGKLEALVAGLSAPTYATLGNHDHWTDAYAVRRALRRNGYAVLGNDHSTVTLRGRPLTVVGIDDAMTGNADPARAFRGVRAGSRVVLTHITQVAEEAAAHGPALVLAGHTHGGHVNIPRVTARIARGLGLRYLAGFYRVHAALLYVNRGIGSSSVPFRAGAPAEVSVFTLRAA